ncbi:hypothetical protein NUU61_000192 [Penicillium alfredii]|uniref:Uncharacterized protein n=1 Tax=Penicillium alfredii TaxID=1506179 RepID=A0A9W9KQU4_9EURO|nr:uncharacterized protein NUU61_000192 [Penicillium alfredii]KAJ5114433.1 hypothetical protein NUU61_000192 [Penicillium alfredii]
MRESATFSKRFHFLGRVLGRNRIASLGRDLPFASFRSMFDLDRFMEESLAFADRRLRSTESTPACTDYTGRRM